MKQPQPDISLWSRIAAGGDLDGRVLHGLGSAVPLGALASGSGLGRPLDDFAGRSVLIHTPTQLAAGLAAIELDGIARRIVLCPPDLKPEHLPHVMATAETELTVSGATIAPAAPDRAPRRETEWVLLTSGTTGVPKLVAHTLASLTGAIKSPAGPGSVWSTFYDIRRYGGLQVFLRAALGGGSLVLSDAREAAAAFIERAGRLGVTHISGTPSHWRRALMTGAAGRMAPRYVRLSGEIADQGILDDLRAFYRNSDVAHAFASTEAGVAFDVGDGRAGFPAGLIGREGAEVEMKIEEGSLRIRSARTASRYLGDAGPLRDADGFVDNGDMIERRGERCYFSGRRGGIINVGGLKVHPEEVEAVINRHPAVRMSLVRARKNPFTGAVVVADVVLKPDAAAGQDDILAACRGSLAPHKIPATIRFVPALDVSGGGKLARVGA